MDAMATVDVPYLQVFKDRHGHVRYYYRRKDYPRVTLPDPSSAAFWSAYDAAGRQAPATEGAAANRTEPGSIYALIVAYYQTAEWRALRESTKTGYRNMLDRFRVKHGHKSVAKVTTKYLDELFEEMALKTPGAARNLRKRLRRVFRLAVKMEWRKTNPVTETDAPKHTTKGFTPWTEDDIAAFEKHWPSGSRERLALALLLYSGQRRSDVVTMGRQHVRDGRIHVVQLKTSARLAIRIHPTLRKEIDVAPAGMTFILTQAGKPFSAAGFTAWFRKRAEKAGVKERTPHGLRKAAGRRLAEAGCTGKQIMAVLGHTTLAEAENYTRDADQATLADTAVGRLVNSRQSTSSTL